MKGETVIRALALVAFAALFITDFGLDVWAKPVGREVYMALLAVALGVDVEWARGVLKAIITKSIGGESKE